MGKKKKTTEEPGGGDTNQAMTVSLFIIILAFFIMLNSIAVVDETRKRTALGSLMENFGILSGGPTVVEGLEDSVTPKNVSQISELVDFSEMFKDKEGMTQDLIVTGDKRRSTLSLAEHRLFKPGGTALIPESFALLDKLGEIIRNNSYPVDIIGNVNRADDLPEQTMPPRELSTLHGNGAAVLFDSERRGAPGAARGIWVGRIQAGGVKSDKGIPQPQPAGGSGLFS